MKSCHFLICSAAALFASVTYAEEGIDEIARKLHQDLGEAMVTVKAVIDMEVVVGGSANQSQEQKLEVPGTVIQANGLTVLSNASIDIGKQIEQQLRRQARGRDVDVKTTFKEVNLLLPDGTEIPSKVVLKDGDLDLAFVLPDAEEVESEGVTFTHVSFPEVTPEVQLLDSVAFLNRLGQELDRELSVYVTTVEALIKKPRRFMVTHNSSIGTPAFLATGEVLGLYVRRIVNGGASNSIVILPSKEVARLAKEAATAQPIIESVKEESAEEESAEEESVKEAPQEDSEELPLD